MENAYWERLHDERDVWERDVTVHVCCDIICASMIMGEWTDRCIAWMDGWMNECMNEWMDGWMNGWMNEWMNG